MVFECFPHCFFLIISEPVCHHLPPSACEKLHPAPSACEKVQGPGWSKVTRCVEAKGTSNTNSKLLPVPKTGNLGADGEPACGSFQGAMGRLLKAQHRYAAVDNEKCCRTHEAN